MDSNITTSISAISDTDNSQPVITENYINALRQKKDEYFSKYIAASKLLKFANSEYQRIKLENGELKQKLNSAKINEVKLKEKLNKSSLALNGISAQDLIKAKHISITGHMGMHLVQAMQKGAVIEEDRCELNGVTLSQKEINVIESLISKRMEMELFKSYIEQRFGQEVLTDFFKSIKAEAA